jgi:hypothetical protein
MSFPRRIRIDLMTKSELAIHQAIGEIENMVACDERLTNAQILLSQAKNLVSDFVDEQIVAANSTPENPPPPPSGGGK